MDANNTGNPRLMNLTDASARCFNYVRVFSDGFWSESVDPSLLQHRLVRFHAQLVVIVFSTTLLHYFLRRIYLPRFSSEILVGILLGPTFLEKTFQAASAKLFPRIPDLLLSSLVKYGYSLFVFAAGVRMDPTLVSRTGRNAWILGLSTFFISIGLMHTIRIYFIAIVSDRFKNVYLTFARTYFSLVTSSQFVGVSNVLMQLKITNSRLGHLALAATMISDLLRFGYESMLGYMNAFFGVSYRAGFQMIIWSSIFVLGIMYPLRFLMLWFIRNTPEDKPVKEFYTTLTIALALILASTADSVGMYYAFGPYLFGLVVPAGSPLATSLLKKLDTMILGLFMPLLSTFCAMKFDFWVFCQIFAKQDLLFKVTLAGHIIKFTSTYITAIACKLTPKDAAAFSLIIDAKCVFEVGILMSYSDMESRDIETTGGVFLIFMLASVFAPLIKTIYDPAKQYIGYKKKSIEQASEDTELKIVACAYKLEDAIAAIKLLVYSNPTKQSPIVIYGLCLEELVSSAVPVWINHQLGQKTKTTQGSRSQSMIDVFNYFKSQYQKLNQVHVFTAISPLKQMHEDICWLSFEKAASLVIIPFHKKWNSKGKLVSTNPDIRAININVLERAPCSIGILIDRPKDRGMHIVFQISSMYRVCVVFIGGPDDREALSYALRMAGSGRIQLTVMHVKVPEAGVQNNWDTMLDNELLRGMRDIMKINHTNINYIEECVQDGSDTTAILRSVQDRFDLFMVGRSHDTNPEAVSGLSDWLEMPELGPLGDLLASADITYPVSSLVVQQQILKASHSSILN